MEIKLNSIMVDDQQKALEFYTEKLGFIKKQDIPMGEYRWLSVVSPAAPDGTELVLEPIAFPPAHTFQMELYKAGIPQTALAAADVQAEFEKLRDCGVKFTTEPTDVGSTIIATFEDTCGNLIQLYQG
ncbi:MAG: VOC family protein [Gammaproteobacteria bacterium]|nr:VOC family protein [Gammaproteobacteria bacterium]NNF62011.1 VOC family protein [Gammaproteobacteria bacterium]